MIEFDAISFAYNPVTPVFEDFSWKAQDHECWAVIGPSGCGKSTLLYLAAGLCQPGKGQVRIRGRRFSRPRPETGLILQDHGLLPWRTIRQNVQLGLQIRQFYGPDGTHAPSNYHPYAKPGQWVNQWLDRLGIAGQATKYPGQVSGGQRQRAAIARTLVLQPDLLLMDEPFSSLDAPTREALQDVVIDLHHEMGIAVVIVTHNIEEAVYMGQKILVLGMLPNRAGEIIDNPEAFTPGYRSSLVFAQRCSFIREMLRPSI